MRVVPQVLTVLWDEEDALDDGQDVMTDAVTVVNEHRSSGATPEIRRLRSRGRVLVGASQGSTNVYLPNITK